MNARSQFARPSRIALALILGLIPGTGAADLDTIGVSILRQVDPSLLGQGIHVAIPEAVSDTNALNFEVVPSAVGQPPSLFTYLSKRGVTNTYPNSLGVSSGHANIVGNNFFGITNGVAPLVSHVDNYEADFFFSDIISSNAPIAAQVVNQSFAFDIGDQLIVDRAYDDYAESNGTVFVSVVGNGGPIYPPGTAYNSISAGIYGRPASTGPTVDGRCKPDLVAPDAAQGSNSANSYSAPYIAGSASVLLQAGLRGDAGPDSMGITDMRTIKALLINGAVKPANWTNDPARPLDPRYGSGIANLFNSWIQLRGGRNSFIESTQNPGGSAHPPGENPLNMRVLNGWNFASISTEPNQDRVHHYYFVIPGNNGPFTLTATLAWNRHAQTTGINNLDLFLFDAGQSNLVGSSVSVVDNVEHLFIPRLPPGRYDLQVLMRNEALVSNDELYALAFDFSFQRLSVAESSGTVAISWPLYPAGYALESSDLLAPAGVWGLVDLPVVVDTNLNANVLMLPAPGGNRFFRLRSP